MIPFWVVWPLSLIGAVAIQPYQVQITRPSRAKLRSRSSSDRFYVVVGLSQMVLVLTVADILGVASSSRVGLDWIAVGLTSAPVLFAVLGSVATGAVLGFFLPVLDDAMFHDLSAKLSSVPPFSGLQALGATLYGGFSEECLMRLFVMSGLVYLASLSSLARPADYLIGVAGSSLVFGAGHLPLAVQLLGRSARVYERTLLLNGIAGVVFGATFWQLGFAFAVISHLTADLVLHLRGRRPQKRTDVAR